MNISMQIQVGANFGREAAILTVSAAAELAGMHPQTLRQYDRLGLVSPQRTRGGGRRYSLADVERLCEVQRLSQEEGVNLAGIRRIMELERQSDELCEQVRIWKAKAEALQAKLDASKRVFAASAAGDVVVLAPGKRLKNPRSPGTLVLWRPPSANN